jgi:hypothetical protein
MEKINKDKTLQPQSIAQSIAAPAYGQFQTAGGNDDGRGTASPGFSLFFSELSSHKYLFLLIFYFETDALLS